MSMQIWLEIVKYASLNRMKKLFGKHIVTVIIQDRKKGLCDVDA